MVTNFATLCDVSDDQECETLVSLWQIMVAFHDEVVLGYEYVRLTPKLIILQLFKIKTFIHYIQLHSLRRPFYNVFRADAVSTRLAVGCFQPFNH